MDPRRNRRTELRPCPRDVGGSTAFGILVCLVVIAGGCASLQGVLPTAGGAAPAAPSSPNVPWGAWGSVAAQGSSVPHGVTSPGPHPAASAVSNSSPIPEVGTPLANATVGQGPYGSAYDPVNGYVYVANRYNDTVSVLNGTRTVATVRVGSQPMGVLFDPDTQVVYVSNYGSGNVSRILGTSVIGNISGLDGPCLAATVPGSSLPSNAHIFMPNVNGNTVSVLNGTSIVASVTVGTYPLAAVYDPQDGYVYVSNDGAASNGGSTVSVLNGLTVVATLAGGSFTNPSGMAYDPQNGYVYVGNKNISNPGGGFVTVVNGTHVVAKIPVGPEVWGMTYNPANHLIYAALNDIDESSATNRSNSLGVVDGTSVRGFIAIGNQPYTSAFDPTSGLLYATDGGSHNVTVLSTVLGVGPIESTPSGTPALAVDVGETVVLSAPVWAVGSGGEVANRSVEPAGALGCTAPASYSSEVLRGVVTVRCTPTATGNVTVWLNLTDRIGNSVWSRAPIEVFPAIVARTPVASSGARTVVHSTDLGQYLGFAESAEGGSGLYGTYQWSGAPSGACNATTGPLLSCRASALGSISIRVNVSDQDGATSAPSSPASVNVLSDPGVSAPVVTFEVVSPGQQVTMNVTVTGGAGNDTFVWYGTPPLCGGTTDTITCRPSAAGEYNVSASVTDGNGFMAMSPPTTLWVQNYSPSTGGGGATGAFGGSPALLYTGLFLIAVTIVLVGYAVFRDRRPPL